MRITWTKGDLTILVLTLPAKSYSTLSASRSSHLQIEWYKHQAFWKEWLNANCSNYCPISTHQFTQKIMSTHLPMKVFKRDIAYMYLNSPILLGSGVWAIHMTSFCLLEKVQPFFPSEKTGSGTYWICNKPALRVFDVHWNVFHMQF